jgi:hypothetical protein
MQPLVDLGQHILITQQIADGVNRRKLNVFLKNVSLPGAETAIAEIARSPAATSTNLARAFEALHSSSTRLPVSTANG